MSFLHPGLAIAAVLAVSIPIIIHLLFRQRRKPIVWAAMRFLIEAYKKQRRRLQLEQLILLVLRCLVVLLLGLAIARPLLARAGLLGALAGGRTVVLMIDNSLAATMTDADDPTGSALARHKAAANELLGTLGPADRVALISLARPAQPIVMPASSNFAAIARLIEGIPATDAPTDFPGAIGLIAAAGEGDEISGGGSQSIALAVFSDFYQGSADLSASPPGVPGADETTAVLATTPRRSERTNAQVLGITPLRAVSLNESRTGEQRRSIQARIALGRTGDDLSAGQTVTVRVSALRPDAQPAGPTVSANARFEPGSAEASVALRIPIDAEDDAEAAARRVGSADILRVIIDDDPIIGDNIGLHLVPRRDALRVALVSQRRFGALPTADQLDAADWLRLAASPARQAPIDVIDLEPAAIDRAALRGFDAALVPRPDLLSEGAWLALREFTDSGGLVLVTPPAEASVALWTDAMLGAFGLDWLIAREPIDYERARALSAEQPRSATLSFIAAELDALASSVRVFRALPLETTPEDAATLLSFDAPSGTSPLLLITVPGSGGSSDSDDDNRSSRGLFALMTIAADLAWSDLPAKPLMVPLMQELLRQGVGAAAGGGASFAGRVPDLPAGAVGTSASPPARVGQARDAAIVLGGLYGAVDESDRLAGTVAVNADPAAGDVASNPPDAVRDWLAGLLPSGSEPLERVVFFEPGNLGELAESETASSGGTLLLLLIALAAALAETILARLFSHAKRDTISARLSTPAGADSRSTAAAGPKAGEGAAA